MNTVFEWWVLPVLGLQIVLLCALCLFVTHVQDERFEISITHSIQALRVPAFRPLMGVVSFPGYPPQVFFLVLLFILVPYFLGFKWLAATQLFSTVGIGALAYTIKILIHRPRPSYAQASIHRLLNRGGQSFPAGHPADYVARFGFLIYFVWIQPAAWWSMPLLTVLFLFILLVGISRIYAGEHWFTDVLGGYLLGSIWLIVTIYFYQWHAAQTFVGNIL